MSEITQDVVPLFVVPADITGLFWCVVHFVGIVFLIILLEKYWMRRLHFVSSHERSLYRILLWEFGAVVALMVIYIAKLYCVVLPLLFLIAFLSMWYLVDIIHRR